VKLGRVIGSVVATRKARHSDSFEADGKTVRLT
jgi:microcompartment protein CcmK/EutM